MKRFIYFLFLLFFTNQFCYSNTTSDTNELEIILMDLIEETSVISKEYNTINHSLETQLYVINSTLKNTIILEQQVALLIKKDQIQDQLALNVISEVSDLSKVRYLKGLQIIKILYEKTLSLDHHFTSVATFNEINNLSNPNHYPEFEKMKDGLSNNQNKKMGFALPSILGDNIYTSILYSFVSLFTSSNGSKQEKGEELKNVECILDFTLRMHNDLNTIYFETAFLQKSNDNIIIELEKLFVDFTKPIQYKTALKECRSSDDWDEVREHLFNYLETLNKIIKDETQRYRAHKMQINLEFPIDRLLQFITQYNSHIDQGAKFYEKFGIMLDSYENEKQCSTKIPSEYKKLKSSIAIAIDKFNTAYKPVEINGSKMKEVLYGINEYD